MAPTGFPSLQPAYIIKLDITGANSIGGLHNGTTMVQYEAQRGTITTVDGFEPSIEGTVVNGADWLYIDPNKELSRINVNAMVRTNENMPVALHWTGTAKSDEKIKAIFMQDPSASTTPFGQIATTHTFEVGDDRYRDLEKDCWVGNGRFILENGRMSVECRVAKVIPSKDYN